MTARVASERTTVALATALLAVVLVLSSPGVMVPPLPVGLGLSSADLAPMTEGLPLGGEDEPVPAPLLRVIAWEVRPAETISDVARQWGISEDCLLEANPKVTDPNRLEVGQTLAIPLWEVSTRWTMGGETLRDYAEFYGLDPAELSAVNGLRVDEPLPPGQAVYLPLAGVPTNGVCHDEAVVTTRAGWQCIARMPWPVRGPVSKRYGGPAVHKGLDIAAPLGTPIICPRDGVVVDAGCGTAWDPAGTYGLYVCVQHSNGIETLYAHLSRQHVVIGQEVEVGDVLGEVGSTGKSTGDHLHFEVRVRGQLVDPRAVLRGEGQ